MKPRKVVKLPGFYHANGYPGIALSKKGEVYDLNLDKLITPVYIKNNYLIIDPGWAGKRAAVHVLMAKTFLTRPKGKVKYVVNHKDGMKNNPALTNLEYVTYTGNINHAYENGLRSDNTPLEVKDLRTGKVEMFISLQATARFFKRNGGAIHDYIKSKRESPFMDNYSIRKLDEDWPNLTKADIGKHLNGKPKEVIAMSKDSDNYIFQSVSLAAKHFGVSGSLLSRWLKEDKSIVRRGYTFQYLRDVNIDVSHFKHMTATLKKSPNPIRKPLPVKVTNTVDDEVTEYISLQAFCKDKDYLHSAVQRGVWANSEGRYRNYLIEYVKASNT